MSSMLRSWDLHVKLAEGQEPGPPLSLVLSPDREVLQLASGARWSMQHLNVLLSVTLTPPPQTKNSGSYGSCVHSDTYGPSANETISVAAQSQEISSKGQSPKAIRTLSM